MCTVCTDWQDRNRPGAGAASSPAAGTGVEGSPEPAGTVVSHGPQPYVLLPSNSHWPDRHGRTITWWNSARDLNPTYLWETRQAFAAWAAVANVNFVQAGNGAIPIRFGDSGDDNDLGRPGGTLGITQYRIEPSLCYQNLFWLYQERCFPQNFDTHPYGPRGKLERDWILQRHAARDRSCTRARTHQRESKRDRPDQAKCGHVLSTTVGLDHEKAEPYCRRHQRYQGFVRHPSDDFIC